MREGRGLSGRMWAVLVGTAAITAVAVLVVAGGLVYGGSRSTSANGGVGGLCRGFAPVYLVADGGLVTREVSVAGCGDPGPTSVLSGLFATRSSDGVINGWVGDDVRDVRRDRNAWRVDVTRPPTALGQDPVLLLQQIAWTLSAATQSSLPIEIDVHGKPLEAIDGSPVGSLGLPDPKAIAPNGQSEWVRRTCGQTTAYVVAGGHKRALPGERGVSAEPPADLTSVTLRVGQRLTWLPDGLCFEQAAANARSYRILAPDGDSLRAARPGTTLAYLGGGTCPGPSFARWRTSPPCAGGPTAAAWVRVRVIR